MLKAVTNSVSGVRLEDPAVFAGVNRRQIVEPRLQPSSISVMAASSQVFCQETVRPNSVWVVRNNLPGILNIHPATEY